MTTDAPTAAETATVWLGALLDETTDPRDLWAALDVDLRHGLAVTVVERLLIQPSPVAVAAVASERCGEMGHALATVTCGAWRRHLRPALAGRWDVPPDDRRGVEAAPVVIGPDLERVRAVPVFDGATGWATVIAPPFVMRWRGEAGWRVAQVNGEEPPAPAPHVELLAPDDRTEFVIGGREFTALRPIPLAPVFAYLARVIDIADPVSDAAVTARVLLVDALLGGAQQPAWRGVLDKLGDREVPTRVVRFLIEEALVDDAYR